jgi:HEPN domain-containing protein
MPDDTPGVLQELVSEWMGRAQSDLAVARMTEDERIAPAILAFHAQQAAKKALKALLVLRQVEFPHTHAIGPLLNLCQAAGYEEIETLADAVVRTRYAVATPYPGFEDSLTRRDARNAAAVAMRVLVWAEAQVHNSI